MDISTTIYGVLIADLAEIGLKINGQKIFGIIWFKNVFLATHCAMSAFSWLSSVPVLRADAWRSDLKVVLVTRNHHPHPNLQ